MLAALEEFYAAPVEAVAANLTKLLRTAKADDKGLDQTPTDLRCDEFLALYLEQVQSVRLEDWLGSIR